MFELRKSIRNVGENIYSRRGRGKFRSEAVSPIQTFSGIKTVTIATLAEYVDYLESNHIDKIVLFRGQAEDWQLIPKIGRVEFNYENSTVLDAEKRMFNEFMKTSMPFLKTMPESSWDRLALAQHHGMATRLLDWTKNSLAGLWFAVRNSVVLNKGIVQNGVVWIYDVKKEDLLDEKSGNEPFEVERTMAFQPKHITPRIVAQQGWFNVHKYILEKQEFMPFEELQKQCLTKMIIPGNNFADLRNKLNLCGVNEYSLFPDLDGLCKHLVWDNTLLKDEEKLK